MQVKDIMSKNPVTVRPETDIHALAELFVERGFSGVPVVDESGNFLGVVREEGLIFHDKKVHMPSFLHVAMGFFTFGIKRFEEEVIKITATQASQIMEENALSFDPETSVETAATLMIEREHYYCPVIESGSLVGVVTKKDIVRSIASEIK